MRNQTVMPSLPLWQTQCSLSPMALVSWMITLHRGAPRPYHVIKISSCHFTDLCSPGGSYWIVWLACSEATMAKDWSLQPVSKPVILGCLLPLRWLLSWVTSYLQHSEIPSPSNPRIPLPVSWSTATEITDACCFRQLSLGSFVTQKLIAETSASLQSKVRPLQASLRWRWAAECKEKDAESITN